MVHGIGAFIFMCIVKVFLIHYGIVEDDRLYKVYQSGDYMIEVSSGVVINEVN